MSKLQKYNRIAFAIISVPTFITMCIFAFMMVCQVLPERHAKYDQNNGVISQDKAAKNAKEKEYNQYISYKNMYVLDNESQEFVIPVIARTMEKPEPYTERFRLNEAVVDEVIFDDSDNSSSFSMIRQVLFCKFMHKKQIFPFPSRLSKLFLPSIPRVVPSVASR